MGQSRAEWQESWSAYRYMSHTSLTKDAVLFHSAARAMLASGFVVLAAAIVLEVIKRSPSRGSRHRPGPKTLWRRTFGAIEGALSVACLFYVFNGKVDPGTRFDVPWAMLIV